jgi:D-serine deaminase-like pyridoxal phosphate-dependent protein
MIAAADALGSLVGRARAEVDTPALLVDLAVMEANIARIAAECRAHGVGWRPHVKAHKTPEIAGMQLAAGAIGVTCAKVSEAEVMADAGVRSILIANQVVGAAKIARLMALHRRVDPIVCVDSLAHVAALGAAAAGTGKPLPVAIEVNIGMDRAGAEPGEPVVALARAISRQPGLRFAGLMGWESPAAKVADPAAKERAVRAAVAKLTASADACRRAGHAAAIVSCGGTGTFPYCVRQPGVTEVQVGGGIFSDMRYRGEYGVDFEPALTVLATVISRPTLSRIVLDAGKKAMSGDAALPAPVLVGGVRAIALSAEHTTIELAQPSEVPRIGDRIELVVGYSDTTVHLHEEIVAVRDGRVEAVWRVAGRGKLK